jgi:hypothetical protein
MRGKQCLPHRSTCCLDVNQGATVDVRQWIAGLTFAVIVGALLEGTGMPDVGTITGIIGLEPTQEEYQAKQVAQLPGGSLQGPRG